MRFDRSGLRGRSGKWLKERPHPSAVFVSLMMTLSIAIGIHSHNKIEEQKHVIAEKNQEIKRHLETIQKLENTKQNLEKETSQLEEAVEVEKETVEQVEEEAAELKETVEKLENEVKAEKKRSSSASALKEKNDTPKNVKTTPRTFTVTAYTNHKASTGKSPGDPGYGVTASGERTKWGVVACPPGYSFGTKMYIPHFKKTFTCADRGGAIKGNRLDIYMTSEADALSFGRRKLDVYITK